MSLVLCDTNVFIHYFKGNEETKNILLNEIGEEYVLVPSLVLMELCKGAWNKKELEAMLRKMQSYKILHFNELVSEKSVELVKKYHLSHNLSVPDSIIAAMCLVYHLPLFTYNLGDFQFIEGIDIFRV
ncbi:MAG: type II toxin-antitoxin system VapC family toxin [Cytophagales bacterium]|nr:MAG: type II toxin-antitoxin system VapC family toxin [Cytophagales bacterium]